MTCHVIWTSYDSFETLASDALTCTHGSCLIKLFFNRSNQCFEHKKMGEGVLVSFAFPYEFVLATALVPGHLCFASCLSLFSFASCFDAVSLKNVWTALFAMADRTEAKFTCYECIRG